MSGDRVDIALATYNGSSYLTDQLDSILEQSHPHIRLLIRDDGSTDETQQILQRYAEKYPEKITLIIDGLRLGIIGNFSCLMRHCDAPYVMFSDQDDIWEKGKVELMLSVMKEQESFSQKPLPLLVHTDLKVVDAEGRLIDSSFWHYSGIKGCRTQTLHSLLLRNSVTGCASMMNRPLMDLAAPIPEHARMHDWWVALTAATFGKVISVPTPTVFYRQHGKNAVGAKKKSLLVYLKAGMAFIMGKSMMDPFAQPEAFHQRFASQLDEKEKRMLQAYLDLRHGTLYEKMAIILKYRFFKLGLFCAMMQVSKEKPASVYTK